MFKLPDCIPVTAEHINMGVRHSASACPIAHAVLDLDLEVPVSDVLVTAMAIRIWTKPRAFEQGKGRCYHLHFVGDQGPEFIQSFDGQMGVYPQEIPVQLVMEEEEDEKFF